MDEARVEDLLRKRPHQLVRRLADANTFSTAGANER